MDAGEAVSSPSRLRIELLSGLGPVARPSCPEALAFCLFAGVNPLVGCIAGVSGRSDHRVDRGGVRGMTLARTGALPCDVALVRSRC